MDSSRADGGIDLKSVIVFGSGCTRHPCGHIQERHGTCLYLTFCWVDNLHQLAVYGRWLHSFQHLWQYQFIGLCLHPPGSVCDLLLLRMGDDRSNTSRGGLWNIVSGCHSGLNKLTSSWICISLGEDLGTSKVMGDSSCVEVLSCGHLRLSRPGQGSQSLVQVSRINAFCRR